MNEGITIKAYWLLERVSKKTGRVLSRIQKKNLIVNDGLEQVAKILNGVSTDVFTRIGIGTDSSAPAEGESQLRSVYDIKTASVAYAESYKAELEYTFTFLSDVVINEAGVFNTGAIMLNRVVFDDQNCGADVDFHIKVTITVGRA